MTSLQIRVASEADYPQMVRVLNAAFPDHPYTADSYAHDLQLLREAPEQPHLVQWVAQQGGEVIAVGSLAQYPGMFHPDRYHAELAVHPAAERAGIGTHLAEVMQRHLQVRGAREVLAGTYETRPHALAFLQTRGFAEVMRFFDNVLDLTAFHPAAWQAQMQLKGGLRAVSLAELIAERGRDEALRAYYVAFAEVRQDVPRTAEATALGFETFQKRFDDPNAYPEGILLALTDSRTDSPSTEVVALSELWKADSGSHRLDIGLTGTRRGWRRSGLALALKLRGMELAQQRGVTELWTGNATTNQPMLALNEKLGFKPRPAWIEMKWGGIQGVEQAGVQE